MTARLTSGERTLEPLALEAQIAQAARALTDAGVGAGDSVALLMRNDFPFFVASLAARWVGAYATPINWHATPDEAAYVLADSGAKLLIGHTDLLAPLQAHAALPATIAVQTPHEIAVAYGVTPPQAIDGCAAWDEWLAAAAGAPPPVAAFAPGAMIYTSGTTGKPKGVRRRPLTAEHMAAQQRILALAYGLGGAPESVALMTGPMYHSAPNSYGLGAVRTCEAIVLQPRFDAEDLLKLVERWRVTHMHMVPTMFVRLLKLPEEVRKRYDLSSLRYVVHGAAPCPTDVKRRMIDWWGPVIHEYYGSTETGLITAHGSAEALAKPGTVGTALPGVKVRILDDKGAALPAGAIGEVYIQSAANPDFTYHGRDDERAAAGIRDMVTVGDIGWLDGDGSLFLCDRKRDMIISGGVNIYPAEIEAELLALEGVRDCAVFGVPDAEFGEAVCAWIEPQPNGPALTAETVRAALGEKLSRFKIPRLIEFANALPREDSGKIFKRKLREPYWVNAGRTI